MFSSLILGMGDNHNQREKLRKNNIKHWPSKKVKKKDSRET